MLTLHRMWRRAALFVSGCLVVVACGGGSSPSQESPAPAASSSDGAASAPAATAPVAASVGDLFPPGEGRESVLNNCTACHAVACSAIGQRTQARWDGLRETHAGRVPDEDLNAAFTYLKTNFDDSKPEPKVPPDFLAGGCTPPG